MGSGAIAVYLSLLWYFRDGLLLSDVVGHVIFYSFIQFVVVFVILFISGILTIKRRKTLAAKYEEDAIDINDAR